MTRCLGLWCEGLACRLGFFIFLLPDFDYLFRQLATYFFLRAQKEVGKKKGTPVPAPFGFPAMLGLHRSLRNSTSASIDATGLEQCSLWPDANLRFSAPPKGTEGAT